MATVDGDLLDLTVDDGGPDLLAAVVGSEGLFGIVVEVTVKLLPTPPAVETLLVGFDSVADCSRAVSATIAAGIIPAGMEMMDQMALRAAEDFAQAGYPRDAAAILLVELDGHADEVDAERKKVVELLRDSGASSVRQARDAAERERFWLGRKSASPAVAKLRPDYYCMDGTIPRAAIGEVLQFISDRSAHYGLPVANVFHAGDGNLHPLILFDANQPGELATAELAQFHRLKQAFDPPGLLNPGKAIPTLKRCQEYRAIRGGAR